MLVCSYTVCAIHTLPSLPLRLCFFFGLRHRSVCVLALPLETPRRVEQVPAPLAHERCVADRREEHRAPARHDRGRELLRAREDERCTEREQLEEALQGHFGRGELAAVGFCDVLVFTIVSE